MSSRREVNSMRCPGCGLNRLSYFVADDGRCLRCGAPAPKQEEDMSKSKAQKTTKGGERFEVPADFKPKLVDQTAECMHWWRLTGNKGMCKKCGATRVFGKSEQATEESREKVLAYVKAHSGKKVEWGDFAKEVGVSQGRLGALLRTLIDDGTVTEVDHDNRPFVYRLARPKVSRRAA
jgi:uncharacterized protein (DUF983 family)